MEVIIIDTEEKFLEIFGQPDFQSSITPEMLLNFPWDQEKLMWVKRYREKSPAILAWYNWKFKQSEED